MQGEFKLNIDLNTYVYDMDVLQDLSYLDNHADAFLVDDVNVTKNRKETN